MVRQLTAQALGQFQDSRTIDPLIAALHDPEPDVEQAAVDSLVKTKAPRAIDAIQAAHLENLIR